MPRFFQQIPQTFPRLLFALFLGGGMAFAQSNGGPSLAEMKAQLWTRNPDYRSKLALAQQAQLTARTAKLLYGMPGLGLSLNLPNTLTLSSNGDKVLSSNMDWVGKITLEQRLPTDTKIALSLADTFDVLRSSNSFALGLELSQPLLKRPEGPYGVENARRDEARAQRDLNRSRRDIEYKFEAAWWDWALSRAFIEVQERKRSKSLTNLTETERKYQSGLIKEVEVLRIRLNDQTVAATVETYRRQEREKRGDLWQLLQRHYEEAPIPHWVDPSSVLRSPDFDIDKLAYDLSKSIEASLAVENSLLNRLDEQWKLEQTFFKTREDLRPVGDLTASALRGLDSTSSWNLKLGLLVKTPLFDRGDGLRETQAYRLARDNLAVQKQADTLEVRRDLAQRLGELGEIRRQVQLTQDGRELSQRIYQIDLRRFDLGLITSITLIESEDDAFNAELEASRQALRWIKAVRYLETRYRMVRATGATP